MGLLFGLVSNGVVGRWGRLGNLENDGNGGIERIENAVGKGFLEVEVVLLA